MKVTVEYNLSETELEAINARFGLKGASSAEFAKTWMWLWGVKALDDKVDEYLAQKSQGRKS